MSAFLLLYYLLLLIWPALLWPSWRLTGWPRVWLLLAVGAGLLAFIHEIRTTFWTVSAIRLDIPLIALFLVGLYGLAAAVLFRARWKRAAGLLGLVLVLVASGMVFEWLRFGAEAERLRATLEARDKLLFDARFRDPATYSRRFGPFDAGAPAPFPVGHWQADEASQLTRLVVNAEGRAWFFHRCGVTECLYDRQGATLAAGSGGWRASPRPRVGAPLDLRLRQDAPDRLSLETDRETIALTKAPPPTPTEVPARALEFLGAHAALSCQGAHARVRQLWLWRAGRQLYAVAILATLLAGRRADFVHPLVLGEGTPEGDHWRFAWREEGRAGRATVRLDGTTAILALEDDGPDQAVPLDAAPLFRDEAVAFAPLTSAEDWRAWFDVVLVGHFSSAEIPAC